MANTSQLEEERDFCAIVNPRQPFTAMIMGYDRRIIMGPTRNGDCYSIVAMVPDNKKDIESNSWTSTADIGELLTAFEDFPEWSKAPFKHCQDIGLWQLRDIVIPSFTVFGVKSLKLGTGRAANLVSRSSDNHWRCRSCHASDTGTGCQPKYRRCCE